MIKKKFKIHQHKKQIWELHPHFLTCFLSPVWSPNLAFHGSAWSPELFSCNSTDLLSSPDLLPPRILAWLTCPSSSVHPHVFLMKSAFYLALMLFSGFPWSSSPPLHFKFNFDISFQKGNPRQHKNCAHGCPPKSTYVAGKWDTDSPLYWSHTGINYCLKLLTYILPGFQ